VVTVTALAERVEGLVLVVILLVVAGFAGAASFTHVKTWTMDNSPAGTGEWFGWANAVISELVPTACALVIRRRRRLDQPIGYPLGVLIAGVSLSLAAQLAVATPSPSGWLLSAVPALAFVALTKLVLSVQPTRLEPVTAPASVVEDVAAQQPPAQVAGPTRANGTVLTAGVIR
jgi:hypothetical protein